MRIFILLISLLSTSALAADTADLFGVKVNFEAPPSKNWKPDDSQKSETKGMATFKRTAIKDPKLGVDIVPVLSYVYEKTTPDIKGVLQFANKIGQRLPYNLEHQMPHKDGIVNFYSYKDDYGVNHMFIAGLYWKDGIGLTVMGDSTESVYSVVEEDIEKFIMSFYWQ